MPTIRFTVIWSYFTGEFTYRLSFSCGPSVWPVQPQNEFRFANGNQQKGLTLFLQQGASWFLSSVLNSRINGGWIFYWLTFNSHWGRVMHISINNLTIIGSDNGLSPGWCQPIISLNAGILLIQTLGTSVSEILNEIHTFSYSRKCFCKCCLQKGVHFVSSSMCWTAANFWRHGEVFVSIVAADVLVLK